MANSFSNLDFLPKSGFPTILDLSMDFPRISHPWIVHPMDFPPHAFPTPWIFGEAAGAADKKQDWTPKTLGGGPRDPIGPENKKLKKLVFQHKKHILLHVAIQAVLT